RLGVGFGWDELKQNWKVLLAGFLLAIVAASLITIVVRASGLGKDRRRRWMLLGEVLFLTAVVLYFLDPALCRLWMIGGFEYFLRRAFTFSSGLSPLASPAFAGAGLWPVAPLGWPGGAFYLGAFNERRRERMQALQQMEWPGDGPPNPAFERCRDLADQLHELLDGPWPRWTVCFSRSWWVVVLPF